MTNKKRQRKMRSIKDDLYHTNHHKECVHNCNYHRLTDDKNFLNKEKYAGENQEKNSINNVTILFLKLVEALLGLYGNTCFLSGLRLFKWRYTYHRYKRYLYLKIIKKRKA